MTSSLRLGDGGKSDAAAWRREASRQHEIALSMTKYYLATEKTRRAKEHNEAVSRMERLAVPIGERSEPAGELTYRPLFQPGSRVWLLMERVKPGLVKKLARRWHGHFRIKRNLVHVSRLKAENEDDRRPTAELVEGLDEDERFDFDEELLPECSWEPGAGDDKYIVEAILDDRWHLSTGTERTQREFHVKWRGYDEPTWEPVSNLSCGGPLLTTPSSAIARTASKWFKSPMKVSNSARNPLTVGTGRRTKDLSCCTTD
ncbi:hypothetical protein ON010_g132 [Phytophthora cinnamomi]|nr:hypothetical protein ON010_g132 [Phytophthora cinnamomi]